MNNPKSAIAQSNMRSLHRDIRLLPNLVYCRSKMKPIQRNSRRAESIDSL
jgi:hypothetical protein